MSSNFDYENAVKVNTIFDNVASLLKLNKNETLEEAIQKKISENNILFQKVKHFKEIWKNKI